METPKTLNPYRNHKRWFAAIPAVLGLVMTGGVLFAVQADTPQPGQFGSTQHPVSLEALTAGCGEIFTYQPDENQYGVIADDILTEVATIPIAPMIIPVYGYMTEEPLDSDEIRFYGPDEDANAITRERVLASMYQDNTTVFWYSEDIQNADLMLIRNYVEDHPNTLAVKFTSLYSNQELPYGRDFAVSQWGVSQSCQFWDDIAIEQFVDFADVTQPAAPAARPEAPVVTELNENDELPDLPHERR